MVCEIVIHHCTVRVVRRGGWGWGESRSSLVQRVTRALPVLIARQLARIFTDDDEDRQITSPVRVAVGLTMAELQASELGAATSSGQETPASAVEARLDRALRTALTTATSSAPLDEPQQRFAQEATPRSRTAAARREEDHPPELARAAVDARDGGPEAAVPERSFDVDAAGDDLLPAPVPGAVVRLLLAWRKRGVLGVHVQAFSTSALELWLQSVTEPPAPLQRSDTPPTDDDELTGQIDAIVQRIQGWTAARPMDRAAALRARLVGAVELLHELGLSPHDLRVRRALDRRLPVPGRAVTGSLPAPADVAEAARADDAAAAPGPRSAAADPTRSRPTPLPSGSRRASPASAELHIDYALPFVLLPTLARFGYLPTVAAAFKAAGLTDLLPQFAAALAYKVLPCPHAGTRNRAAMISAAAFAGATELIPEGTIVRLAQEGLCVASPLDAVLADAVLQDGDAELPLVLRAIEASRGGGLLLVSGDGTLPVAWAATPGDLARVLLRREGAVLLIDGESADPSLLAALDGEGFRFITDAPPGRGERWRTFRAGRRRRYFTNDALSPDGLLIPRVQHFTTMTKAATEIWQQVHVDRPIAPRVERRRLDRSLTLAASAALGAIARRLWRQREFTTPLLALERFDDLSARVRFEADRVRVVLPLGQRSMDLTEHGLLEDVTDVPWLDDHLVTFGRG